MKMMLAEVEKRPEGPIFGFFSALCDFFGFYLKQASFPPSIFSKIPFCEPRGLLRFFGTMRLIENIF